MINIHVYLHTNTYVCINNRNNLVGQLTGNIRDDHHVIDFGPHYHHHCKRKNKKKIVLLRSSRISCTKSEFCSCVRIPNGFLVTPQCISYQIFSKFPLHIFPTDFFSLLRAFLIWFSQIYFLCIFSLYFSGLSKERNIHRFLLNHIIWENKQIRNILSPGLIFLIHLRKVRMVHIISHFSVYKT